VAKALAAAWRDGLMMSVAAKDGGGSAAGNL